jgi:uncharacterized metal-binding protein YceD (DUF177 family)
LKQLWVPRIDEVITRSYISDFERRDDVSEASEDEMIADDTTDQLPEILDLFDIISESLILNMPAYPRKDGIEAEVVGVTEPGKSVMTDEDARPFARLAAMREAASTQNSIEDDDTG